MPLLPVTRRHADRHNALGPGAAGARITDGLQGQPRQEQS